MRAEVTKYNKKFGIVKVSAKVRAALVVRRYALCMHHRAAYYALLQVNALLAWHVPLVLCPTGWSVAPTLLLDERVSTCFVWMPGVRG